MSDKLLEQIEKSLGKLLGQDEAEKEVGYTELYQVAKDAIEMADEKAIEAYQSFAYRQSREPRARMMKIFRAATGAQTVEFAPGMHRDLYLMGVPVFLTFPNTGKAFESEIFLPDHESIGQKFSDALEMGLGSVSTSGKLCDYLGMLNLEPAMVRSASADLTWEAVDTLLPSKRFQTDPDNAELQRVGSLFIMSWAADPLDTETKLKLSRSPQLSEPIKSMRSRVEHIIEENVAKEYNVDVIAQVHFPQYYDRLFPTYRMYDLRLHLGECLKRYKDCSEVAFKLKGSRAAISYLDESGASLYHSEYFNPEESEQEISQVIANACASYKKKFERIQ